MSRKIIKLALSVPLITILIIGLYFINKCSHASIQESYKIPQISKDSTLKIGIIGDSWVAHNKLDSFMHDELLIIGINNKIISSGHPGAKSKHIYLNLFRTNSEHHSSRFVIESKPDFCIVIAGVNDAASQVGSKYYSFHMVQIIKTLLNYEIVPIIVSLPEFEIIKTINNANILSRNLNVFLARFNNNGEIDNIITYRQTLNSSIEQESLSNNIIEIDFNKVCKDYSDCKFLYSDYCHLSETGNKKLCSIIARELQNKIDTTEKY